MQLINALKGSIEKILFIFNQSNAKKIIQFLSDIPLLCHINKQSSNNRILRDKDIRHFHPVKVRKGQIYNANITENAGSELCGNHLVIIIQGKTSNIFGEKVSIVPIEGNGTSVDRKYQIKLSNSDLERGKLDKDPSRIIFTDIYTIDKARLDRYIGTLSPSKLTDLNTCIKKHLEI